MAIEGTYAAVITPRDTDGAIDEAALCRWLEFLIGKGIQGFAINGATGEFCIASEAEFARVIDLVTATVRRRAVVLAGVGAAGADTSIRLARHAAKSGADALLLPMPYFFPYSQGDLKAFALKVASATDVPVLLYNLPQFSTGLEPETSLDLIRDCEAIIGIKDSSGSLDTLRLLTREGVPAVRLIGNDGALRDALAERVTDGVVSGVACVLPELMRALWQNGLSDAQSEETERVDAALGAFIEQLDCFPTPWGLKIAAEARGLANARFPFPLSDERVEQAQAFGQWFREHSSKFNVQ